MIKRLSDWLYKVSRGWAALTVLVGFLLFTALVLPAQSSRSDAATGESGSPDMSFFYSPADLYRMAEVYGPAGREAYVRARFTFDLAWPVVYTVFLTVVISWVYGKAFPVGSRWRPANLVPVAGMLFDYLENVATSFVMVRYPAHTAVVDVLAPVFTVVKWLLVGGSFVVLLLGIGVGVWRWARGRRERGDGERG